MMKRDANFLLGRDVSRSWGGETTTREDLVFQRRFTPPTANPSSSGYWCGRVEGLEELLASRKARKGGHELP